MGLLGDLTQFGGISLFKKAMKKDKAKPTAQARPFRAKRPGAGPVDPAKVIETETGNEFSEGFRAKAGLDVDNHRKNRKHSY
jgi:hypothetical protein